LDTDPAVLAAVGLAESDVVADVQVAHEGRESGGQAPPVVDGVGVGNVAGAAGAVGEGGVKVGQQVVVTVAEQAAVPQDGRGDPRVVGDLVDFEAAAGLPHGRDLGGVEFAAVRAEQAAVLFDRPVDRLGQHGGI